MNIEQVRLRLRRNRVQISHVTHALVEAYKDGLTTGDLEAAVRQGEVVEDYGIRALLLDFTASDKLPFHVVIEYEEGDLQVTTVTAYIPDSSDWMPDWKTRRTKRGRRR